MRKMPAKSFDAVVTSPPYNLGVNYGVHDDSMPVNDYLIWCGRWTYDVCRLLKDDGSFFLNMGGSFSKPFLPFQVAMEVGRCFVLQNTFHWIKAISIGDDYSAGHFKPINSRRYVTNCHEFVFHFTKTGRVKLDRLSLGVVYADKSNIRRWKHTCGIDRRCRGNVWFIPYETIQSRVRQRPHPTVYPVKLAENCIKISAAKSVIDPFVGIGTTGIAAMNCFVDTFTGIDIDPAYIRLAERRLHALTPSKP